MRNFAELRSTYLLCVASTLSRCWIGLFLMLWLWSQLTFSRKWTMLFIASLVSMWIMNIIVTVLSRNHFVNLLLCMTHSVPLLRVGRNMLHGWTINEPHLPKKKQAFIKVTCAGRVLTNTRPHQLEWPGDGDSYLISCTKCNHWASAGGGGGWSLYSLD